jgi:plastocyanin
VKARLANGLAIGLLALSIARPAPATDLEGRLDVRGDLPVPAEERGRYYWQAENGVLPTRRPRLDLDRDVAVALHGAAPAGQLPTVIVRMIDGGLRPAAIVVRPGTLVRFENNDLFAHELFVPNPASPMGQDWFRAEATSRGSTRDVRFTQEGTFEIRCKRAPHLRAWVAVENVTTSVTPDVDGKFAFDDVTPGNYRLRVFHAGQWIGEKPVEVEDGRTQEVEMQATLPAAPAATAAPAASAAPATAGP